MPLALQTLTSDYRRRSAPIPTRVAFQAPVTGSLRVPSDHVAFADPAELVDELTSDVTSVRQQVEDYLAGVLLMARAANRNVEDDVSRISDAFGELLGELQKGAA